TLSQNTALVYPTPRLPARLPTNATSARGSTLPDSSRRPERPLGTRVSRPTERRPAVCARANARSRREPETSTMLRDDADAARKPRGDDPAHRPRLSPGSPPRRRQESRRRTILDVARTRHFGRQPPRQTARLAG